MDETPLVLRRGYATDLDTLIRVIHLLKYPKENTVMSLIRGVYMAQFANKNVLEEVYVLMRTHAIPVEIDTRRQRVYYAANYNDSEQIDIISSIMEPRHELIELFDKNEHVEFRNASYMIMHLVSLADPEYKCELG